MKTIKRHSPSAMLISELPMYLLTLLTFVDEKTIWLDAPESRYQTEDVGLVLLVKRREEKVDNII